MTRAEALYTLLHLDPPEALPVERIGHHYTLAKHPSGKCCPSCERTVNDPELIKRDLGTAYVTWRRQEHGADISCVVSVRKQTKLIVVRTYA